MNDVVLIKHETVMKHFDVDSDIVDRHCTQVSFYSLNEEGELNVHDGDSVDLSITHWQDMGKPDTITVAIRPGDHLNEEGENGNT